MRAVLFVTIPILLLHAVASCQGGVESVVPEAGPTADTVDRVAADDVAPDRTVLPPEAGETGPELPAAEEIALDQGGPSCKPGEGCLLDKCEENEQCTSGWCVQHMGEGVCTITCEEECPAGWSCKQVSTGGPDVAFICVSGFPNLCRPCSDSTQCTSPGGVNDACIAYPDGSFCGGPCAEGGECPWGFSCKLVTTVDGIELEQCVADAGVCPCTDSSVVRGLWTPCSVANEHGACQGKRVCTVDGLAACDAPFPAPEACNGIDDDCDGLTDEPDQVGGNFVNLCEDDNECTADTCGGPGGCSYEPLSMVECKDGNSCTAGDHCEAGACVGLPTICDDKNPCTDDACDVAGGCTVVFNQTACDDGNPCTVNDTCGQGECHGFDLSCDCTKDSDCAAFEDGNPCNGTLFCRTDKLPWVCLPKPGSVVLCAAPPAGPDAPCQKNECDPATGKCALVPDHDGMACDEGNACTLGDVCSMGTCLPGPELACVDGNPCTADGCQPAKGCTFTPAPGACNDGDSCTIQDACVGGACTGGPAISCDDGEVCTADSCEPKAGCVHSPKAGACDDGNACTVGDHCQGGQCLPTATLLCNDGDLCTDDACNLEGGCVFTLNKAPCDDQNLCTTADHCYLGKCIGGGQLPCKDGNPCTEDTCSPLSGCTFKPLAGACDDNDVCTVGDACAEGWCKPGALQVCKDSNPCTNDSCEAKLGCQYLPNQLPCTDDNACTDGDTCAQSKCVPGPTLSCDDADPCTDDSCAPKTGCLHEINTDFQTDELNCGQCGKICPEASVCQGGKCLLMAGQPCLADAACLSGYCRLDWDGAGTFCAQDAVSCVYALAGNAASQVSPGARMCGSTTGYRTCSAGIWSPATPCQAAACAAHLFTAAQQCVDGTGCTPDPNPAKDCTPYACNAAGCLSECTDSGQCASGHVCQNKVCSASPINKPGAILPGSEYYGPALAGWVQCAGWKNTPQWDILTTDWIHSCGAESNKQLRVRLHDTQGNVVFDETYPMFTPAEMSSNMSGCNDSGYGVCGKYGPSGKALFIYKPNNGNSGCHGDDNSCGAVKIAPNSQGETMGQNYLFLGGKRSQGATYRDHTLGSSPDSEIRWPGGGQWNGCGGDSRAINYAVAIYRSL